MKQKSGKISYNVHRWDSSGFHYGRTITITRARFDEIIKSFTHVNRDILRALLNDIEYTDEGAYSNISQAHFIAMVLGLKLKDGYNTFFKWIKE